MRALHSILLALVAPAVALGSVVACVSPFDPRPAWALAGFGAALAVVALGVGVGARRRAVRTGASSWRAVGAITLAGLLLPVTSALSLLGVWVSVTPPVGPTTHDPMADVSWLDRGDSATGGITPRGMLGGAAFLAVVIAAAHVFPARPEDAELDEETAAPPPDPSTPPAP